MATKKKTSTPTRLYTQKALRAFRILRQTQDRMLDSWADALVELKLRTVPVENAAHCRRDMRGLRGEKREELKNLAEYWDKVAAMPIADRAVEFEELDECGSGLGYFLPNVGDEWDRSDLEQDLADAVERALHRFALGKRFPMNG